MKKNTTIKRKLGLVQSLNFTQLKSKLRKPEEGKGLTVKQANQAEKLYKQFLCLLVLHPEKQIVPNRIIDHFWHAHILDTRRYHADCEKIFGYYVHHYPYFGLRGKQDAKNLQNSFKETNELWVAEFGKPLNVLKAVGCTSACRSNDGKKSSLCGATCAGRCYPQQARSSICGGGGGNCVSSCEPQKPVKCNTGGNCVSSKKEKSVKRA